MKMDIICSSKNDEYYTPVYAVTPIVKYLKPSSTVWCPFDTRESNYVKVLSENGHNVIYTHILDGNDFFKCDIPNCDYIISNPPYSAKNRVFDRLFKIGKPFAMLVGVVGLFESKTRFDLFKRNEFEIMYMNKRVSYLKYYQDEHPDRHPPFSSVYITHKILPKQIVFQEIQ